MENYSPHQGTLLIVDDNLKNLKVLMDLLRDRGFDILVARSGEEALSRIDYRLPDLILLDVMMPGPDGFEICRRLKAYETTREIPIIFMTALTDVQSKLKGFEVGGVDYVTKPLEYQEVMARLQAQLTIRRLQQDLVEKNAELQAKNEALQQALDQVNLLSGLLPICANCKKIRDEQGRWQEVTVYIRDHSEAEFSHGICPDCMQKLYPGYYHSSSSSGRQASS
ncbi:MAG TPA: response regulator [Anaerolineae bacterium]|nr:response regulator [Anaerolineae bacterium]